MNVLIFSIGAALGAPLRFFIDSKLRPKFKFPVGIFLVNIAGSFIIGLYAHNMNYLDRKSTRLNSSHSQQSRMPSSA